MKDNSHSFKIERVMAIFEHHGEAKSQNHKISNYTYQQDVHNAEGPNMFPSLVSGGGEVLSRPAINSYLFGSLSQSSKTFCENAGFFDIELFYNIFMRKGD